MNNDNSATVIRAYRHGRRGLEAIVEKAADSAGISRAAMIRLLDSPAPSLLEKLFAAARQQRERHFGNRVFLYGFLYISTHCRNRCSFCFYRKTNTRAFRYRKTRAEITDSSRQLARSGVHLIDLTAGEDPCFFTDDENGFDPVIDTVRSIRADTDLPVMASVGVVPDAVLDRLAAAGADWYACYQETHNRQLFDQLRVGQSFEARCRSKVAAKARGMLVEEGLLCGVGETSRDLVNSFNAMARLGADQVRVMTFVPQAGTPMTDYPPASSLRECIAIALMRIAFPGLLIPASLDVDGLAGLRLRLEAGANVVTSLVPPGQGLAGVAQSALDIEDGRRSVKGIAPILRTCGLQPATADQYQNWIAERKRIACFHDRRLAKAC
ncbi:methylornithine synthase PylB [Desulfosarcina sp.]|uniref:methylornithine synthase PylB n=1 Tax=Desulfosarcina sp. TaxID=2027861 RepID=UPI0029B60250|nr:methylornithine synthase PylB [Desulfosarcina sp.]MDX2452336.1 methylornithine synthase PylB [Desulfosarcina sp.]MDX2490116.1 methylornithine synthase PylB [Desulfosarcina sp.]